MKKNAFLALSSALILVSCNIGGGNGKTKLEMQNDSLVAVNTQRQAEFDELLGTLNSVEEGLQRIKDAENFLSVQASSNKDMNKSTRERLEDNLRMIEQVMSENREKLARLTELSKKGAAQSKQFQSVIARLEREVAEKNQSITLLRTELSKRDARIAALSDSLDDMQTEVELLSQRTKDQEQQLISNDQKMNEAFFVFGTKKELKEEKILEGGSLFSSKKVLESSHFNAEYFTTIDIRNFSRLQLFAKKAEVLTKMPKESYDFVEDEEGNLTLVILDRQLFWSVTRYLVIEVN